MKPLAAGLGLTLLVTALLTRTIGPETMPAGLVMGLVATAIEVAATRWLRRAEGGSTTAVFQAFGAGMFLRLAGVGLFAGLVLWDRGRFPPLATGLGYLGVLVPLLFLELRLIR